MTEESAVPDKSDIFLSYASEDRELVAKPLVRAIRRTGLSVWYDEIDSPLRKSAQHLPSTVETMLHDALGGCNQAWLLIGPTYNLKNWTRFEAKNASALAALGKPHFGVIYHGLDLVGLSSALDDLQLDLDIHSSNVIHYKNNPQDISARLLSFVEPRVSLVLHWQMGPIDIAIFEQLGQVFFFTDGGLECPGKIVTCDFSGREIGKGTNMDGFLDTFLEHPFVDGRLSIGKASAVATMDAREAIILGIMNHPKQELYSAPEIAAGVVQNLGGNLFLPVVTSGPLTIGYITDDPPLVIKNCVKRLKNSGIAEWSRIYFSEDGGFTVL